MPSVSERQSTGTIPAVALLGALEVLHGERELSIIVRQADINKKSAFFRDEFEHTLRSMSLVHKSWTSPVRRVQGRILMITNADPAVAKNALLSHIFGPWTSMVYLSSDEKRIGNVATWTALTKLLRSTPNVSALCLEASEDTIHRAATRLGTFLSKHPLATIRTIRLYRFPIVPYDDFESRLLMMGSDTQVEENASFYEGLKKLPHLQSLALRAYVPVPAEVISHALSTSHIQPASPLPLPDLIRAITSIPLRKNWDYDLVHCIPHMMICRDAGGDGFRVRSMKLTEDGELPVDLTFSRPGDLFADLQVLQITTTYDHFYNLSPFRALRYLNMMVSVFDKSFLKEIEGMVTRMPNTLEVLLFVLFLEPQAERQTLPRGIKSSSIDTILSRIPLTICPRLDTLYVDLKNMCAHFRTPGTLPKTAAACTTQNVRFSDTEMPDLAGRLYM